MFEDSFTWPEGYHYTTYKVYPTKLYNNYYAHKPQKLCGYLLIISYYVGCISYV